MQAQLPPRMPPEGARKRIQAQQSGRGQGEPGSSPGGPGVSPRQGAVRRRDHAAQRRRRRARRHRQHAAVSHRADRNPADLRKRPAGQRERRARRPTGGVDRFSSPGPHLPWHRRPHRERARSRQPHDARRGRRAERGWGAVSRHLRRGRSERLAPQPAAGRAATAILFRTDGAQSRRATPTTVHLQRSSSGATTAIASKSSGSRKGR